MPSPQDPPLTEYQQTVQDFIALLQALRAWRKVINLYYQGRLIGRATVNFAGLMQKSSSPKITLVDHFDDLSSVLGRKANTPPAASATADTAPAPDYAEPPAAAPPRIVHRCFPPDPAKPRPVIDWAALYNTPFEFPDPPEPRLGFPSPEAISAGLAALDAIRAGPLPSIPLQQIDLTKLLGPPVLPVGEPAPAAGTAAPSFTDGGFLDGPGRFGTLQDNTPLEAAAPPFPDTAAPAEPAAQGGFSGYGPAILGLPPILRSLVGLGPDPLDGQSPAATVLNLAGNLAVGAAEGVVNLVPKTAVSLINTIYEGSRLEALGEGGHLTQDEFDQIRATKAIDSTGTIVAPANPVQAVGETFGEFAAPFFLGGAVQSLGRLAVEGADALLGSLTELNAAKATAKIEPALIEATEPLTAAPNTGGQTLYRGDGRLPEAIFNEGFVPRGTSTDLQAYVDTNSPSAFVGTSKTQAVSTEFALDNGGYVYQIDQTNLSGIDVNLAYPSNTFADEREIAILGGVPKESVISAQKALPGGGLGPIIPNPFYEAP